MTEGRHAILLFDGVCNMCNGAVQFVIDRDPHGHVVFASLQSDEGRALLTKHGIATKDEPDTMVLIEGGRAYERSTAVLRLTRYLTWPWKALAAFLVLPRFLRDLGYRFIASHRYAWFGKTETCRVPTPELRRRFLDARPDLL